jgi:hypothetical protein
LGRDLSLTVMPAVDRSRNLPCTESGSDGCIGGVWGLAGLRDVGTARRSGWEVAVEFEVA